MEHQQGVRSPRLCEGITTEERHTVEQKLRVGPHTATHHDHSDSIRNAEEQKAPNAEGVAPPRRPHRDESSVVSNASSQLLGSTSNVILCFSPPPVHWPALFMDFGTVPTDKHRMAQLRR